MAKACELVNSADVKSRTNSESIDQKVPQTPSKKKVGEESTPSVVPIPVIEEVKNDKIGFVGECPSGLMANSMVDLVTVGLSRENSTTEPTDSLIDSLPPSKTVSYEDVSKTIEPLPTFISSTKSCPDFQKDSFDFKEMERIQEVSQE